MNFSEAKVVALGHEVLTKIQGVTTEHRQGREAIGGWKGLELFQNVGTEEIFNQCLPGIEAGRLVIGPAFWVGPEGEIRISEGVVGLFHSKFTHH